MTRERHIEKQVIKEHIIFFYSEEVKENYRVIENKKEGPKFCEQCRVEFAYTYMTTFQLSKLKEGKTQVFE